MGFHPQQKVGGTVAPDLLRERSGAWVWLGSGAISGSMNEARRGGAIVEEDASSHLDHMTGWWSGGLWGNLQGSSFLKKLLVIEFCIQ